MESNLGCWQSKVYRFEKKVQLSSKNHSGVHKQLRIDIIILLMYFLE
jgi:hypothetical protein